MNKNLRPLGQPLVGRRKSQLVGVDVELGYERGDGAKFSTDESLSSVGVNPIMRSLGSQFTFGTQVGSSTTSNTFNPMINGGGVIAGSNLSSPAGMALPLPQRTNNPRTSVVLGQARRTSLAAGGLVIRKNMLPPINNTGNTGMMRNTDDLDEDSTL